MGILHRLHEAVFGQRPPSLEARARELQQQLHVRTLEAALGLYDNWVDPLDYPYADQSDFFYPIGQSGVPYNVDNRGYGEVLPLFINLYQLKLIRDNSRKLCAINEFAINAVENRTSYIVGKGFKYRAVRRRGEVDPADDPLCQRVQAFLDEWMDVSDWACMEQEIVKRSDRDGECFIRFFDQGRGNVSLRIIEPEHVQAPAGDLATVFGVKHAAGDVMDVEGYYVAERPMESFSDLSLVPADDVLHVKTNVDANALRGLPLLYPVRKNLERADRLLRNMSTLAQVQSTYAVIRKHKGASAASISAFQAANATFQGAAPQSGANLFTQSLFPGSIIDTSAQTDYEFPSATVDASGYVQILQAELRAIAARLCMPEYMLTADASNANYSSTLVAESPWVKHAERLQSFYLRKFGAGVYRRGRPAGVLWRVLAAAVASGILPTEVLDEIDLQAETPQLVVRDGLKETQRRAILRKDRVLSVATWQAQEGLDSATEAKHMAAEPPPPAAQPGNQGERPPGVDGEVKPGESGVAA